MNLYHKHKRDTKVLVLKEYLLNMNRCYMFLKVATWIYKLYTDMTSFKYELSLHVFKGSNFYLQIIHWYDFIQVCDKDSTIKDNRSKDNSCFLMDSDKTHECSIKDNTFILALW